MMIGQAGKKLVEMTDLGADGNSGDLRSVGKTRWRKDFEKVTEYKNTKMVCDKYIFIYRIVWF